MGSTREIQLEVDALGYGTVVVDGIDLSDQVSRMTLDARVGEPTVLYLEAKRGGVIQAQGLVLDRTSGDEEVLQFLRSIDPPALEAEALGMLGLGLEGVATVPEAMLAVLQKWVIESGNDDGS
jgi:hypothetical protein